MLEQTYIEYRREKNETAGKGHWIIRLYDRRGKYWSYTHNKDQPADYDILGTVISEFKQAHGVDIVRVTMQRKVSNVTTDNTPR